MNKTCFTGKILTLVLILNCLVLFGDKADKINKYLLACYKNKQFNGNVLVAQKGKIIFNKAYGFASFNPDVLLTTDSQFRLASVTKQFTAMAIMILKEQNKLKFTDPVKKYLPELSYRGITIHHLLTHTSGLPDYISLCRELWDPSQKDLEKKKAGYQ